MGARQSKWIMANWGKVGRPQKVEVFQKLTPAQIKLIEDAELAKCAYREDSEKQVIVIWYDGFPLIEIPKCRFKSTDFRQIPAEAERILREQICNLKLRT